VTQFNSLQPPATYYHRGSMFFSSSSSVAGRPALISVRQLEGCCCCCCCCCSLISGMCFHPVHKSFLRGWSARRFVTFQLVTSKALAKGVVRGAAGGSEAGTPKVGVAYIYTQTHLKKELGEQALLRSASSLFRHFPRKTRYKYSCMAWPVGDL